MIAVVRHGAREDDLPRNRKSKSDINLDPALSSIGENQARDTGKYIAEYLRRRSLDGLSCSIRIISSPFLRTLQTAAIIADELKLKQTRIEVWDPICEELKEDLFQSFPIPNLNFSVKDKKVIFDKLLKTKKINLMRLEDPEEIITPSSFPEKEGHKHFGSPSFRAKTALEYLICNQVQQDHDNSREVNSNVVILVTHAFFLQPFVQYFSPKHQCKDRDYCSIAWAKCCDNQWTLAENCSSDHLI